MLKANKDKLTLSILSRLKQKGAPESASIPWNMGMDGEDEAAPEAVPEMPEGLEEMPRGKKRSSRNKSTY